MSDLGVVASILAMVWLLHHFLTPTVRTVEVEKQVPIYYIPEEILDMLPGCYRPPEGGFRLPLHDGAELWFYDTAIKVKTELRSYKGIRTRWVAIDDSLAFKLCGDHTKWLHKQAKDIGQSTNKLPVPPVPAYAAPRAKKKAAPQQHNVTAQQAAEWMRQGRTWTSDPVEDGMWIEGKKYIVERALDQDSNPYWYISRRV